MSAEFYRVLHVTGALLILSSLAALWGIHLTSQPTRPVRLGMAMAHGVGLALMLVSGFARLGQLGLMSDWPMWAFGKLAVWLFLGAGIALAKRKAKLGLPLFFVWIAAAALAAYLGIVKP